MLFPLSTPPPNPASSEGASEKAASLGLRSENRWRWGGASVERMGDSLLLLLQKLCSRKPAEGTACSLIVEWVVVGAAALKVVRTGVSFPSLGLPWKVPYHSSG